MMLIQEESDCTYKTSKIKAGDITINIRSSFYPKKNLYDILFAIVIAELKEKSA